jgi:hypothetical protein
MMIRKTYYLMQLVRNLTQEGNSRHVLSIWTCSIILLFCSLLLLCTVVYVARCVGWKALAGKVAIEYSDLDSDSDLDLPEDVVESEALLTSAGVEGEQEEDISVYGKAYAAFGGGQEGKEACMALAALCEVASINTLISNFIQPLQVMTCPLFRGYKVHLLGARIV